LKKVKNGICIFLTVVLLSAIFSCGFSSSTLQHEDFCSAGIVVFAAESESPVTADDNSSQSDSVQNSEKNDVAADNQVKNESAFFKWAIPITCILSLALAVFLAIRGANKRFGDGWE